MCEPYVGPDFTLRGEGSLYLLTPQTPEAQEWINIHVDPTAQFFGQALVIEPRYVVDFMDGIDQHGFTWEGN